MNKSRAAREATYVTSVDLLRAAIDAIEWNPDETPQERMHPQDAYNEASNALAVVTGARIAETQRSWRGGADCD